jgi:hypothetical protein
MNNKVVAVPDMDNPKLSQKDIQNFNNRQIYTKGFTFQTQAGNGNDFPVKLNGKARQLYGITIYYPQANIADEDIISLSINEENVITEAIWWNFNPQGAAGNIFKREAYFPLKRALSGTDTIQLQVNSVAAHKIYPVFWMSNSPDPENR